MALAADLKDGSRRGQVLEVDGGTIVPVSSSSRSSETPHEDAGTKEPVDDHAEFLAAFEELSRWEDTAQRSFVALDVHYNRIRQRPALALKALGKVLEMKGEPTAPEGLWQLKLALLADLGWTWAAEQEMRLLLRRFPPAPGLSSF